MMLGSRLRAGQGGEGRLRADWIPAYAGKRGKGGLRADWIPAYAGRRGKGAGFPPTRNDGTRGRNDDEVEMTMRDLHKAQPASSPRPSSACRAR